MKQERCLLTESWTHNPARHARAFSCLWENAGWCAENRHDNKKSSEKALIPLPPTGLVSFFFANPDVVQTNRQPKRAVGLYSRSAIAQSAKF